MPDPVNPEAAPQVPAPPDTVTLQDLQASLRRHRIWLIIVSVFVGFALVGVLGAAAVVAFTYGAIGHETLGPDQEQVAETKREVQSAYGDRLQDVKVRLVKVDYGGGALDSFPFSLMSGPEMKSLYVEYKLSGSDVLVASVLTEGMYEGVASSGMLPTKGSIASRMTLEQFERLLKAYGAETKAPLGSIRRYNDNARYMMESGTSVPEEVTVGNTSYPSKELWSAAEGKLVKGDVVDVNESMYERNALIFREDPKTGEFTFLGTEPANQMW